MWKTAGKIAEILIGGIVAYFSFRNIILTEISEMKTDRKYDTPHGHTICTVRDLQRFNLPAKSTASFK